MLDCIFSPATVVAGLLWGTALHCSWLHIQSRLRIPSILSPEVSRCYNLDLAYSFVDGLDFRKGWKTVLWVWIRFSNLKSVAASWSSALTIEQFFFLSIQKLFTNSAKKSLKSLVNGWRLTHLRCFTILVVKQNYQPTCTSELYLFATAAIGWLQLMRRVEINECIDLGDNQLAIWNFYL